MMKKLMGVAAAVLVLAGCTAAPADDTSDTARTAPSSEESAETNAPTETPEPEEVWPYTVREDGEEILLGALRNEGLFEMDNVSDEQLLIYGYAACEQLAAGVPIDDVDTIPVDYPTENVPGWNDRSLAGLASETLCTEYHQHLNN